jgi:hypothetical protein
MRIDSRLAEETIVQSRSDEPPTRRILIAISTLIVAAVIFAIPSLWSGQPTSAQSMSPAANAAHHDVPRGSASPLGAAPGQGAFGFLEFDWDREAGVPGFDPWPGMQRPMQ